MITIKIASIPERMANLEKTIEGFLSRVDVIQVYLNNYSFIPAFLRHKKISVFTSQDYGDMGDIGKFYQIESATDYVLTLDDDLIYPKNYTDLMIKKIDFYQKKAFICVHGNILPRRKLTSYYKDKKGVHFEKPLKQDTRVDIPGTGTLGFHADKIKIAQAIFSSINMTDIWLAIYAKQNDIPIISIERDNKWVMQARGEQFQKSIYQACFQKDAYQTEIVNNAFL